MASRPAGAMGAIDLTESIRTNLGIRFARVEKRVVRGTLRLAGRFETPPSARREYRVAMAGRVEVLVNQYRRVAVGDLLFRLVSPAWREIQKELGARSAAIDTARDAVVSARAARAEGAARTKVLKRRVREQLESITATVSRRRQQRDSLSSLEVEVSWLEGMVDGGDASRRADLAKARVALATVASAVAQREETLAILRNELGELEAEQSDQRHREPSLLAAVRRAIREQKSAEEQFELALNAAGARIGVSGDALRRSVDGKPRWRAIGDVEVRAVSPGVVDRIDAVPGSWREPGELVVSTVDADRVRFRAVALQCDFASIRAGLPARIVPPSGTGGPAGRADVAVALEADARRRTFEVIAMPAERQPWMRDGVSAHLELVVDGSAKPEIAIPVACTVRDGLETVFFRRDPRNPDRVTRVVAEVGPSDGEWVVVYGGVMPGDEVVRDGIYELKLSGEGKPPTDGDGRPQIGHFHADGTWHAGPDH